MQRTLEEYLKRCPPVTLKLVQGARHRIQNVVPQAVEKFRPGWGLIGYNAPRYFAFIVADERTVQIGFEWGARLSDPSGVLHGGGSQMRYFRVRKASDLTSKALLALLFEAAELAAQ